MSVLRIATLAVATVAATTAATTAAPPAVLANGSAVLAGPVVITQGGTYTGSWTSTDPDVPAVRVSTTAPVVIERCTVEGPGILILAMPGGDLTVRDCAGGGTNPNVSGRPKGDFVAADGPKRLVVEHNDISNLTMGVWVNGYAGNHTAAETIIVRYNRARDMDDRNSNGAGGYLSSRALGHFVQIINARGLRGVDISWNEAVQQPWVGATEDVMNLYKSGGTSDSPMDIHDNFIRGAYPINPATDGYSGGGIITDGDGNAAEAGSWAKIHHNQVIATTNYGIAFANGHDHIAHDNTVLASNVLPDGRTVAAQNVGVYISPFSGVPGSSMLNDIMRDNRIGWMNTTVPGNRNDMWFDPVVPGASTLYALNQSIATNPITRAMEDAEHSTWLSKVAAAGVTIGPRSTGPISRVDQLATITPDFTGRITLPYCSGCQFSAVPDAVLVTGRAPHSGANIPANLVAYGRTATGFTLRALNQAGTPITTPIEVYYHASLGGFGTVEEAHTVGVTTDGSGFATIAYPAPRGVTPVAVVASGVSPSSGTNIVVSLLVTARTATTFTVRALNQSGAVIANTAITIGYLIGWSGAASTGGYSVRNVTTTVTTDASGYANVTFPTALPGPPTGIQAVGVAPATGVRIAASLLVHNTSATGFRVRVLNQTGAVVASTAVTLSYHAVSNT